MVNYQSEIYVEQFVVAIVKVSPTSLRGIIAPNIPNT